MNGEPTTSIYLEHGKEGKIIWLQVEKPERVDPGKQSRFHVQFNTDLVLAEMSITNGWKASALQKHMREETGMSEKTFYRLWADLKEKGLIKLDSENEWIRKSNQ